ncbi:MAG: helix-turn-helix transcriptional regulator [Phycisphaerales bacterium]
MTGDKFETNHVKSPGPANVHGETDYHAIRSTKGESMQIQGPGSMLGRSESHASRLSRSQPSAEEILASIDPAVFPPILTVHQAAALLQLSPHTIYGAVSDGRFKVSVRRGKPLRFWRDRLIQEFFRS